MRTYNPQTGITSDTTSSPIPQRSVASRGYNPENILPEGYSVNIPSIGVSGVVAPKPTNWMTMSIGGINVWVLLIVVIVAYFIARR